MDDRGERVEERQRLRSRRATNLLRQRRRGQRPGRQDRGPFRQGIHPLAHQSDVGMVGQRLRHPVRIAVAIHRQRRPRRHAMRIGLGHDQRSQPPHLLMQQPHRIRLRVVGAEAVRTDEFGQAIGLVRRRALAAAAHLGQAHAKPRFGQLPRRFRSGEPAADDMDVMSHAPCL
ncbi:hypothetical protein WR25_00324 [Diploscapter pachys]|uniref:Uncharacterized protein n=1 Tax=Diploscapter pachys TaxID=2018661 RepID=A0A2A2M3H0_9BILA|nr:hypothetical protein WR25_00324 [Diploscapter pachys]